MKRSEQLEFAGFAFGGGGASGTGKEAGEGRGAIRGPSRGLCGAIPAGGGTPRARREATPTEAGGTGAPPQKGSESSPPPPKPKLVAAIYAEEADERGNLRLRKVTTSRWLSVRQIADTLRVSVQTVYSRIEFGELPAHRIGNAIRISSDDFEAYLRRTSTEEELIWRAPPDGTM